jgi:hypothetical protein
MACEQGCGRSIALFACLFNLDLGVAFSQDVIICACVVCLAGRCVDFVRNNVAVHDGERLVRARVALIDRRWTWRCVPSHASLIWAAGPQQSDSRERRGGLVGAVGRLDGPGPGE